MIHASPFITQKAKRTHTHYEKRDTRSSNSSSAASLWCCGMCGACAATLPDAGDAGVCCCIDNIHLSFCSPLEVGGAADVCRQDASHSTAADTYLSGVHLIVVDACEVVHQQNTMPQRGWRNCVSSSTKSLRSSPTTSSAVI